MAFALLNAFFVFLANYFYFQKLYVFYTHVHSLHIATVLWLFPSIYLYVKSIVSNNLKKELVHLLPGLLFGTTSAILFYGFLDQEERALYLSTYRTGVGFTQLNLKVLSVFRSVDVLMIVVQVIYYSIAFIRIPGKYHDRLMQEYSNIENFSINWLKLFNIAFVLVGLLSVAFYILNPFHQGNDFFLVFFLFFISAFIWVIGIWSFKQKRPKVDLQETEISLPLVENSIDSGESQLEKSLLRYFEEEQPFLQPDLSLTAVCKQIGTNRSYLSGLINSCFGMNFNTFVNQYRIRYLNDYLKQFPHTPKDVQVQIAGFGSVSSLNRARKKSEEILNQQSSFLSMS
ncbi:helix-turn-helix domain-containing protein [Sunxiuqinia indica]|uniref:helix-turn-helix domain-containing protein n=1 Tax=Sunxiuqinia indica TaxID=2692584 RepID=UPI001F189FF1|nr:hypothetical protein [Sunxiuqinia indica]